MKHVVTKHVDLFNNFIELKDKAEVVQTEITEKIAESERINKTKISQIYLESPLIEPDIAPDFKKRLESAIVLTGAKHTFDCIAIGSQPLTIKWFKNGFELVNLNENSTSFDEASGLIQLIINRASLEDNALFSCRVTNELGMAETSAYLKVKGNILF